MPAWLRRRLPVIIGALVGLGVALAQWERAPDCVYPARGCRVGHPEDCDFPPCPTHGSVHWVAVAVIALLVAAAAGLIAAGIARRRD